MKRAFIISLIVFIFICSSFSFTIIPLAGYQNNETGLGWELLDNNTVFHMWNKYNDYYFNASNGIQFSNHYQELWTTNVLMLGYHTGDTWNLLYRTDELSNFNRQFDNQSEHINITLWKDLSHASYDFRLALRYHLGANDTDLTIIPYIKNLGIAIPFQIGFGWEMKDIKIKNTLENDCISINNSMIPLNQSLDIKYTNISYTYLISNCTNNLVWNVTNSSWDNVTTCNPYNVTVPYPLFTLIDSSTGEFLYLKWNKSLDYLVWIKSRTEQYNAPVTLFIKVGNLDVGQEKSTLLNWLDAPGYEDYTTYDEVDPGNDFIVIANTITVTNMASNVKSYVKDDKGADHFGDFEHLVDVKLTAAAGDSLCIIWAVTDTAYTRQEMTDALEGIHAYFVRSGANYQLVIRDVISDNSDIFTPILNTQYYLTIERSDTAFTCEIYSDSARTVPNLLDTLSVVCTTDTYRTIIAVASFDHASITAEITCIISNLDLQEAPPPPPPTGASLNILEPYPVNESIDICPCIEYMSIYVSTNGTSGMNLRFYRNDSQNQTFYMVSKYINITNGTYNFCLDGHIDDIYYPMRYNETYYWYVNLSQYDNSSNYNVSGIYHFTTAESPADCVGGYDSPIDTGLPMGIVGGVLGGIIGSLIFTRKRKEKNNIP